MEGIVQCAGKTAKKTQCSRMVPVSEGCCYQHKDQPQCQQLARKTPVTTRPVSPRLPKITPITVLPVSPKLPPVTTRPISPKLPIVPPEKSKVKIPPIAIPELPQIEEEMIDPGTPVEDFISLVIKEQDADIAHEKEYLGYVRYLLNADNKYDIFARLYPETTCVSVDVRVEVESRRVLINPDPDDLIDCVYTAANKGKSVGVYLSYHNHANALWFDTAKKEINRYDPQAPGDARDQSIIDDLLRKELAQYFPDYNYLGNTLEDYMCIQGVREVGRRYKADYFCQDYSLLYDLRRAKGMSHEDAAWDLVEKRDQVLEELAELLRSLAYKKRQELGKQVPSQYRKR